MDKHDKFTLLHALILAQSCRCPKDLNVKMEAFRRFADWYPGFPEPYLKKSYDRLKIGLADPDFTDDLRDTMKVQLFDDCKALLNTQPKYLRSFMNISARVAFWGGLVQQYAAENSAGTTDSTMDMYPDEYRRTHDVFEP